MLTDHTIDLLIVGILAILGSSGFWAFVIKKDSGREARDAATKARDEMLLGLGHDRIMYLSGKYIALGEITADEYENLDSYLYGPYLRMGGNGTAKRNMEIVYKLEVKQAKRSRNAEPFPQHKLSNEEIEGETK